jgi:hypothetical protein
MRLWVQSPIQTNKTEAVCVLQGFELSALSLVGSCSPVEPHPQPNKNIFKKKLLRYREKLWSSCQGFPHLPKKPEKKM